MRKFNLKIFMIFGVIFMLLNFLSWSGLEAYNTSDKSHTMMAKIGSLWTILRFPFLTIFQKYIFTVDNVMLYSTAVALNCAFYAIVVERIFYFLHRRTNPIL